jgi:hypothetical protein
MSARSVLLLALASLLGGCCTSAPAQHPTTPPATAGAKYSLPPFPLDALRGPHLKSVKLYINADGSIRKLTVYVERAGVPDWVHEMADQTIGKGDEVEFEVEEYSDGNTVYEVTRKVDGKLVELSVRSGDRSRLYIERKELPLETIPEVVRKAAGEMKTERYNIKERADGKEHVLDGELAGKKVTLHCTGDGKVIWRAEVIPSKVKLGK